MSFIDWVYPPKCMACRNLLPMNDRVRRERWMCTACEAVFVPLEKPLCKRCGCSVTQEDAFCAYCQGKTAFFTQNRAIYEYEDVIRDLMHEMKFRNRKHIAAGLCALWAVNIQESEFERLDWLCPVPMYKKKRRQRGFNQADEMARALSKRFGVPSAPDMLIRTRDTAPQSGLSPRQRTDNIAGAFKLNSKYDVKNKYICLIDDIYTTGASLNECAKMLSLGGAAGITSMTLSIAVKNKNKL